MEAEEEPTPQCELKKPRIRLPSIVGRGVPGGEGDAAKRINGLSDNDLGRSAGVSTGRVEIQSSRHETRFRRDEIQSRRDEIRFGRDEIQSRRDGIRSGRAAIRMWPAN
ncbi:MAG: hypothetical protein JSW71_07150 [Gemmatimonadota bacterium]|nr:MAG: hypothetical protein JSW71_07150 [Gemmatimonadota bacterium]